MYRCLQFLFDTVPDEVLQSVVSMGEAYRPAGDDSPSIIIFSSGSLLSSLFLSLKVLDPVIQLHRTRRRRSAFLLSRV